MKVMDPVLGDLVDLSGWQLDRYAEDFGALFKEYQELKGQFTRALQDKRRASDIQHGLEALLQSLDNVGVVVTDGEGVVRSASPAAAGLLGVDPPAMQGRPLSLCVAEADRGAVGDLVLELGRTADSPALPAEVAFAGSAGRPLVGRVLRAPDAAQGYRLHWLLRNKDADAATADRDTDLYSQLYARSTNGILITDANGVILSANPAFATITGYAEDEVRGQTPRVLSSGRHGRDFYARMWQALEEDGEWQGEVWNRRKNGEIFLESLNILAVRNAQGATRRYVAMFYDVGNYSHDKDRIYELANHDPLTGLPNRALGKDRLKQAIAQARRNNGSVGLLFIDLDRFKEVNDTLGHAVGDQLLIEFSWRLVHVIRDGDTAARLGGDEFVVIAPGMAREDDIRVVARKIIDSLAAPFIIEGRDLYVGASVGVAVFPTHGDDADALLQQADTAMYAAKTDGGNACQFFDEAIGRDRVARLDMETALRRALALGQLRLVYQPQVAADDGKLVGVEALLRWEWPGHGNVPPEQFIPLAESTGLILSIGEWVLRAACLQLAAWGREGLPALRMAVNITARQLNDEDFARRVAVVIEETQITPGDLEIEITESQLMERLHVGLENLKRVRALGVAVAIDDFGTGYSSLGRIRSLPIDRIKVDKSFVVDLNRNNDSYAIADAIVSMANALRLGVIAEGVEIHEQAQLLAGIHCHEFQGYLFGKPQPPEAIAALLKRQKEKEHEQAEAVVGR